MEYSFSAVFTDSFSGGLSRPRTAPTGPDGNADGLQDLYVASGNTDEVIRYDGKTGALIDSFVSSGDGGDQPGPWLSAPTGTCMYRALTRTT